MTVIRVVTAVVSNAGLTRTRLGPATARMRALVAALSGNNVANRNAEGRHRLLRNRGPARSTPAFRRAIRARLQLRDLRHDAQAALGKPRALNFVHRRHGTRQLAITSR